MTDIKEQIKGSCTFLYYRANNLWYETEAGMEFPVPVSDIGEATFDNKIKGIYMMRYIRKHLDLISSSSNGKTADSESEN